MRKDDKIITKITIMSSPWNINRALRVNWKKEEMESWQGMRNWNFNKISTFIVMTGDNLFKSFLELFNVAWNKFESFPQSFI